MESILNFLKTDVFLLIISGAMLLLVILYISNIIKLSRLKKEYTKFMEKLGNGRNIDEMLRNYLDKVEKVEEKNNEINSYCKRLEEGISNCTQKIGMVRYNAFKDTGSDLSFTLALLDEHNNGVVLNGIYARDMSNIYAKPIKNGQSKYTLSQEEKQAIEKAIDGIE